MLLFSSLPSHGEDNCWVKSGQKYQIDPWLLYSIGQVESDLNPMAVNNNKNSTDAGLMQINTNFWLPELKKYQIGKSDLFDPCTSIDVGAWVLKQSFEIFGYSWEGVGAYNAGTSLSPEAYSRRRYYSNKVKKRYELNTNFRVDEISSSQLSIEKEK